MSRSGMSGFGMSRSGMSRSGHSRYARQISRRHAAKSQVSPGCILLGLLLFAVVVIIAVVCFIYWPQSEEVNQESTNDNVSESISESTQPHGPEKPPQKSSEKPQKTSENQEPAKTTVSEERPSTPEKLPVRTWTDHLTPTNMILAVATPFIAWQLWSWSASWFGSSNDGTPEEGTPPATGSWWNIFSGSSSGDSSGDANADNAGNDATGSWWNIFSGGSTGGSSNVDDGTKHVDGTPVDDGTPLDDGTQTGGNDGVPIQAGLTDEIPKCQNISLDNSDFWSWTGDARGNCPEIPKNWHTMDTIKKYQGGDTSPGKEWRWFTATKSSTGELLPEPLTCEAQTATENGKVSVHGSIRCGTKKEWKDHLSYHLPVTEKFPDPPKLRNNKHLWSSNGRERPDDYKLLRKHFKAPMNNAELAG